MEPSRLIVWALCIGVAWLILASCTGADEWLESLFGRKSRRELEKKIEELEKRLNELEKK